MNELELILTELAGTSRVPARAVPTGVAERNRRRPAQDRRLPEAVGARDRRRSTR